MEQLTTAWRAAIVQIRSSRGLRDSHSRRPPMRLATTVCAAALLGAALPVTDLTAQVPPRSDYAFTDVNVIPMDSERVLSGQTVVVRNGRISAMGPASSTVVPAGATRIDGSGRYLLPGLAEMHGHIPGANAAAAEDVLFLYVAAGATTVRGMQGHPSQLELKRRAGAGEIIAPRLWLAAPPLSGNNARDAAMADSLVRAAKAAGFDLLKVHEGITAEAYAGIVKTATEVGLPWAGHVSQFVGVEGALRARQSTIDHIDDYIEALNAPDSPGWSASGGDRVRLMALNADASRIDELARATRQAGVAIVPTQILWEVLRGARDPALMRDRPENRYMAPMTIEGWTNTVNNLRANADPVAAAREVELRNRLLAAMNDEGVLILMGTDAPQLFSVPGFALYRELPVMVEAGMTPYEVLRTGTVNVANFLGVGDEAGTVAVGKRADLLLLDANPLEDITAIERNAGVMIDGRWLPARMIRDRLDAIAAKHAAGG
ncbi:MAG: amidohydrolase family protein [Gemmatimonadetes bacterium]|nr:amidohydrolase family protein [Gemmatimonadota bacterium]